MVNAEKQEKMVSLIIPVYNAEKSVGYCINSIVSQTYRNLEIILVNDGSTDQSLQICNNYAQLDSRVKVVDIANSGVSKARNTGLSHANGEYIQFVDSDDVISPEMVSRMVTAIETYRKDLCICGFEMITLDENKRPANRSSFSSGFIGHECVFTKERFLDKLAFILWRSCLLECSWNKLFRRNIIQANQISFPEDMELGEDFSFNLDYFQNINGAILLEDKMYYYLQTNKDALTRRYRENLFEEQFFLIQKFEKLIKSNITMRESEEIELAEYAISKVIASMRNLFEPQCLLDTPQKKAKLAMIMNDDYVRAAFRRANYINPDYAKLKEYMDASDVQAIYDLVSGLCSPVPFQSAAEKTEKPLTPIPVQPHPSQPEAAPQAKAGRLNRLLSSICAAILKVHHFTFFEKLKYCLDHFGIKYTFGLALAKLRK